MLSVHASVQYVLAAACIHSVQGALTRRSRMQPVELRLPSLLLLELSCC
jgi:hypothetical protein